MATDTEVANVAGGVEDMSTKLKQLVSGIRQLLSNNTAQVITWDGTQDTILSDAGKSYTGPEVSNALGTLQEIINLADNQAVGQGDHKSNYEKLAKPIV